MHDEVRDSPGSGDKKRKAAQRRSVKQIRSLSDALADFTGARQDTTVKPQARRNAFAALAAAFGTQGREAIALVESYDALGQDVESRRLIALELSMTNEALHASNGASADWMHDHRDWPYYIRICASSWASAADYVADAGQIDRRRNVQLPPDSALDNHPWFRVDGRGYWAPGTREAAIDQWRNLVADPPITLDPSLPLSIELETRRQLLQLAQLDRRATSEQVKQRALALKALTRALGTAEDLASGKEAPNDAAWIFCLRLFAMVGRNPEVWAALTTPRNKLICAAEVASDWASPERWAEAVAASWCTVEASRQSLSGVSDLRLAALPRAARDHNASALLHEALQRLEARALARVGDAALWNLIERIPHSSPADRRWVTDLIAQQRRQVVRDGSVDAAQDWSIDRLLGEDFRAKVIDSDPRFALPALSIALRRIEEEIVRRDAEQLSSTINELRVLLKRVDAIPQVLVAVVGGLSEDVESAVRLASSQIRQIIQDAPSEPALGSERIRPTTDVRPWNGEDVILALRDLEFDPTRSSDITSQDRASLREFLIDAVKIDSPALAQVASATVDLPPEAIGLVWEVGVLRRSEELLRSVPRILEEHVWAHRLWEDVLTRIAGSDTLPIPVDIDLARRTVASLLPQIANKRSGGPLAELLKRMNADGLHAVDGVRAALADVVARLERVKETLDGGIGSGAAIRG